VTREADHLGCRGSPSGTTVMMCGGDVPGSGLTLGTTDAPGLRVVLRLTRRPWPGTSPLARVAGGCDLIGAWPAVVASSLCCPPAGRRAFPAALDAFRRTRMARSATSNDMPRTGRLGAGWVSGQVTISTTLRLPGPPSGG
jgi:hypothetical protein